MIIIDILLQGVLLGGLYALFAAGLSLVFGIMRLVNLAHGDLIVLAAYVLLGLVTFLGVNPFVAILLAAPAMFVIGYALQRLLLNRLIGEDLLPPLLVTFGLSTVIQNGLLQAFSADTRRLPVGDIQIQSVSFGGLNLGLLPILTLATAVAVIMVLNLIFYYTPLGRSFRATADDPATVALMGVRTDNVRAVATGLALVIVAISALYLGVSANFDPSIGPARLIYAFEAVIIGGLGSLWGTLAGGLILGIAQVLGGALNPEWQILAGHLAFIVVLLVRPNGLFPRS